MVLAVALVVALLQASPSRSSDVIYCSNGIWWNAGTYCTDGGYNNEAYFAVVDQASWAGGEYIEAFGIKSNGSWCCGVVGLGMAAWDYYPTTYYVKEECWNRSNEPGYGNIAEQGSCERATS